MFIIFWRNIGLIYLPFGIQVEYLIQVTSTFKDKSLHVEVVNVVI